MLGESVWETDARDCRYFNPSVDGLKYHTILTASVRRLFREETKPMRDSFGADRRTKISALGIETVRFDFSRSRLTRKVGRLGIFFHF